MYQMFCFSPDNKGLVNAEQDQKNSILVIHSPTQPHFMFLKKATNWKQIKHRESIVILESFINFLKPKTLKCLNILSTVKL